MGLHKTYYHIFYLKFIKIAGYYVINRIFTCKLEYLSVFLSKIPLSLLEIYKTKQSHLKKNKKICTMYGIDKLKHNLISLTKKQTVNWLMQISSWNFYEQLRTFYRAISRKLFKLAISRLTGPDISIKIPTKIFVDDFFSLCHAGRSLTSSTSWKNESII